MKSNRKKTIIIVSILLASMEVCGAETKAVLCSIEDVGVDIVCRGGNIMLESEGSGKFYAEFQKSPSNSIINEASEDNNNENFMKITVKEASSVDIKTSKNYVSEILLPYSSALNENLTNGIMIVQKNNKTAYIKPDFEFYKYDAEIVGKGDTVSDRQKISYLQLQNKLKTSESEDERKKTEKINMQLNTILAHSIINSSIKQNNRRIYVPGDMEENTNAYLREYLSKNPYSNNAPVFVSELFSSKKEKIENYSKAGDGEAELLAAAAKRYLNWAVEYRTGWNKYNHEIYSEVKEVWKNNGAQTSNYYTGDFPIKEGESLREDEKGNPIPYVQGGIDTPRTFYRKMYLQDISDDKILTGVTRYRYNSDSYMPGVGKNKTIDQNVQLKYAGCDSIGMLTGIIEMSGLNNRIPAINGSYPATMLDNYTKDFTSGNAVLKENGQISYMSEKDYKKYRYAVEDIEKITTIVPYYDDIQIGDILVRISGNETDIAVVTEIRRSTDMQDPMSKEKITVVTMDRKEKRCAKQTTWNLLEDSGSYTPRRLLVKNTGVNNVAEDYEDKAWDVLGKHIDDTKSSVTVGKKYEQTQDTSKEKDWRFIPNTGEYLVLDEIKVNLCNKAGVKVSDTYPNEYKVELNKAYDRCYNDTGANDTSKGNIYRNKAENFQVSIISNKKIIQNSYQITASKTENVQNEIYSTVIKVYLTVGRNGNLCKIGYNGEEAYSNLGIGIRPVDATHAYPGDDLIPAFTVTDGYTEHELKFNEKDYIAVYDKKMLWRANLYIDEGADDWNNIHPWDTANNTIDWYGTNEWNKNYNLSTHSNVADLTTLNTGDGKQVVKYTDWTPSRVKTSAGSSDNTYTDRVAYDYPYTKDTAGKYIDAWDSPFDFLWKMNKQKDSIKKHFKTKVDEIENSQKTNDEKKEEKNANGIFPNGNGVITGNQISINTLSTWNKTSAPNNRWKFYWKTGETINNEKIEPYIPGLGLYLHAPTNNNNEVKDNSLIFNDLFSTGTDCLGFAERTASYKNNKYSWTDLPEGRIEGKNPDEKIREPTDSTTLTHFPQTEGSSKLILTKEEIGKVGSVYMGKAFFTNIIGEDDAPTQPQLNDIKQKFKTVIPGDIITYSGHIGVVAKVDTIAIDEAKSIQQIMDSITVVESNYGASYNYVMVRESTGGVNKTIQNKTYKSGSWFYDWGTSTDINLRDFKFERLIIKE